MARSRSRSASRSRSRSPSRAKSPARVAHGRRIAGMLERDARGRFVAKSHHAHHHRGKSHKSY